MEPVPNTFPSLFYGYSVIWALLLILMLTALRSLRRVEKELTELRAQLASDPKVQDSSSTGIARSDASSPTPPESGNKTL